MPIDHKLAKFLDLVPTATWRSHGIPPVWRDQVREALSEGFITVGFGGLFKLTDAGREARMRPDHPAPAAQGE